MSWLSLVSTLDVKNIHKNFKSLRRRYKLQTTFLSLRARVLYFVCWDVNIIVLRATTGVFNLVKCESRH